jgi:hypothetical protein
MIVLAVAAFVVLALVLWVTSHRPARWLERRYWRRRKRQAHDD